MPETPQGDDRHQDPEAAPPGDHHPHHHHHQHGHQHHQHHHQHHHHHHHHHHHQHHHHQCHHHHHHHRPPGAGDLDQWLQQHGQCGRPRGTHVGPDGILAHFQIVGQEGDRQAGVLGKGSFGVVWRCRRTTRYPGRAPPPLPGLVAVKEICKTRARRKDSNWAYHAATEIAVLRNMNHPNIVVLYDVLYDERRVYLVLELLPYGELYDWLVGRHERGGVSISDASTVLGQLCCALVFLHDSGIVHRDLKPENILIAPESLLIKVLDFGLAKHVATPAGSFPSISPAEADAPDPYAGPAAAVSTLVTPVGSEMYCAWEALCRRGATGWSKWHAQGETACKMDIYSTGVIAYAMFFARLPFLPDGYAAGDVSGIQRRMEEGLCFPDDAGDRVPHSALALIAAMLNTKPEQRPSARDCAQSEWLRDFEHPCGPGAGLLPPRAPLGSAAAAAAAVTVAAAAAPADARFAGLIQVHPREQCSVTVGQPRKPKRPKSQSRSPQTTPPGSPRADPDAPAAAAAAAAAAVAAAEPAPQPAAGIACVASAPEHDSPRHLSAVSPPEVPLTADAAKRQMNREQWSALVAGVDPSQGTEEEDRECAAASDDEGALDAAFGEG